MLTHFNSLPKDLQDWFLEHKSLPSASLLNSLLEAGHGMQAALDYVTAFTLSNQESSIDAQAQINSPQIAFFPTMQIVGNTTHLTDGQQQYPISFLCCGKLRALQILDFLSNEECEAIKNLASPSLRLSKVVGTKADDREDRLDIRSSDGTFLNRQHSALIADIQRRLSAVFQYPLANSEDLQVLRYGPGNEYQPHFDYFDYVDGLPGTQGSRGNQRVATMLLYLNDVQDGGHTLFPEIGLSVAPVKGSVLYFDYFDPLSGANPYSLHAGAPILGGEKWVATQWVCLTAIS